MANWARNFTFAPDPRMRANVGIRRRLAPLLDNSRNETELAHGAHRQHRGRGRTPWDTDREHREACAEQNARYYKDLARHARHRIPAEPRFNHIG